MRKRVPDFFAKPKISPTEAIFAIVIVGFVVNTFFAYADVVVHDNFILPVTSYCYPTNQSEICTMFRELADCPPDGQSCIGAKYWTLLPNLVLAVSIFTAILVQALRRIAGAKINGMFFLVGFAWFMTGIILPYTGWGDFTYFIVKGEPIPEILPWLNGVGWFPYINFGSEDVEAFDLYFVMGIGLGFLILMWYGLTHVNRKFLKFTT